MDSVVAMFPSMRSSLSYQAKPEENVGQKPPPSYLEINISASSDKKIKQTSAEAKANVSGRVLSTDEQRQRNSAQALYNNLPDADECELVSESQAKSVLASIHHGMYEFKSLFNKDNQSVNRALEPLNDFENKPLQYLIFTIQELFFHSFQEMTKDYAKTNQILSECFKEQMKASREKEQERLEQIKEEKAKAYKSGKVSAAIDWGCVVLTVFAAGTGVVTGGVSIVTLGWIGTGIAAGVKAGFEWHALNQRAAGNDKEAEESEHIVQIASVMELAGLFFTLGMASLELAAEAAMKNARTVKRISSEFCLPLEKEAAVTPLELTATAQRALQAEGLKVELKVLEELTPPLWKSYDGLEPLIKDTLLSQWKAATFIRESFLALQSFNMASNAWLKAQIAQCEGLIQTLSQEAGALKKFAQTVTQQLLRENTENLRQNANRFLDFLKIVKSLLAQHAATMLAASNAIAA